MSHLSPYTTWVSDIEFKVMRFNSKHFYTLSHLHQPLLDFFVISHVCVCVCMFVLCGYVSVNVDTHRGWHRASDPQELGLQVVEFLRAA